MNDFMLRIWIRTQNNLLRDDAQDLVEYALVVALIAFGAVVAMGALATEINTAFEDISSDLASALA